MFEPNAEFTNDSVSRIPVLSIEIGLQEACEANELCPDEVLDKLHEFINLPSYYISRYFYSSKGCPDVEEYYKEGGLIEPAATRAVSELFYRHPILNESIPIPIAFHETETCLDFYAYQISALTDLTKGETKRYAASMKNDFFASKSRIEQLHVIYQLILTRAVNRTFLAAIFDLPLGDIINTYKIELIREILDLYKPTSYFQARLQLLKEILNHPKYELLLAGRDQVVQTIHESRSELVSQNFQLLKEINNKDKEIQKVLRKLENSEERLAINVQRLSQQEAKATEELNRALKRATGNQYEELQTARRLNEELQGQIERQQELLDLYRDYFDAVSAEAEIPPDDPEADLTLALAARVVVLGGHVNWHNKLKQNLPSYKYIEAGEISYDANVIRNADLMVVYAKYLSHMAYEKAAGIARIHNVPIVFLSSLDERELLLAVNQAL